MKAYLTSLILFFVSFSAFAQNEVAVGDTSSASRPTRAKFIITAAGMPALKTGSGPSKRLAMLSEVPTLNALDNRYVQLGVSYTNPSWLTSLPATKITGLAGVATSGSFGDLLFKPSTANGYGLTDVDTYLPVSSYSAMDAVTLTSGTSKRVLVATDERYGRSNQWYVVWTDGTGTHADKLVTISEK
jgi:hypothetical protein